MLAIKQAISLNKHLLNVAKYWLGGFVSLMIIFYLIISFK